MDRRSIIKRPFIVGLLCFVLLTTLACNIPVALGTEKMTPLRFDTTGDRRSYSGEYSCQAKDTVILIIDENGVATLSTTGPVYVDYINCVLDPSGFAATYTISGLADPDTRTITFTSCNEGAFTADGEFFWNGDNVNGQVSCTHATGSEAGQLAIMLSVPSGTFSP